jgi:RNA polymerase sigma-70 factor (ECF subfamily)
MVPGPTRSTSSEADLVARCRRGDEDAWRALVQLFSRYVQAIAVNAYRLAPSDAEDIFQEVFARTFENLDRLRNDDAIRPWIGQLTRRLSIDRLRSRAREQPADDGQVEPPGVDDSLARIDEALTVHEALARLSDSCRQILDRFFTRDESYDTIGAALDIPRGTIASRISRCLKKLREEMEGRNQPAPPSSER